MLLHKNILFLHNSIVYSCLSYDNLFNFSGIAQENLLQVLQILLKAKLLTCSDEENSLTGASVIELFLAYKK